MPYHHPLLPSPSTSWSTRSPSGNVQSSCWVHRQPVPDTPICEYKMRTVNAVLRSSNNPKAHPCSCTKSFSLSIAVQTNHPHPLIMSLAVRAHLQLWWTSVNGIYKIYSCEAVEIRQITRGQILFAFWCCCWGDGPSRVRNYVEWVVNFKMLLSFVMCKTSFWKPKPQWK